MDSVDQFFEFSKQYKEALVLAATQKVVDNKKMSQFDKDEALMEMILDAMIEEFLTSGLKWDFEDSQKDSNFYGCGLCGKKYKGLNTFPKHAKNHQLVANPGENECSHIYNMHNMQ